MDRITEARLTNNGRVPLPINITEAKLQAAERILEGVYMGDAMAVGEFKSHMGARYTETLTTGDDFIFALQHLVAVEVDTLFQERERTWTRIVPTRTVQTFEGAKVFSLDPVVGGFARPATEPGKPDWVPPVVPEGTPYPEFKFKGEVASGGGIHKAGGAFGVTFERMVSNPSEIIPQIPEIITDFLLDREEWDAWNGVLSFLGTPQQLQAGTTLNGVAVAANSKLDFYPLALAVQQLKSRRDSKNRSLGINGLTLLVPIGGEEIARYVLSVGVGGFQTTPPAADGGLVRNYSATYNPLTSITDVVESEFVPDGQWALIPTPGSLRGNRRYVELGRLAGHEGPEVRVDDATGTYYGGGKVGAFEGSFATDTAKLRGRVISGALQWDPNFAIWSTGEGETPFTVSGFGFEGGATDPEARSFQAPVETIEPGDKQVPVAEPTPAPVEVPAEQPPVEQATVDSEGYQLDENGERVLGADGEPVKAPVAE